jgi:hypothetical protein
VESEVKIISLDVYVKENGLEKICLLKIDTEGHELEVLKGARGCLESGKIDLIHIEFNEMNVISRVFFRDFLTVLKDYIPYRLLPSGAIQLNRSPLMTELFAFQNIIFIHKRFCPNRNMEPTSCSKYS